MGNEEKRGKVGEGEERRERGQKGKGRGKGSEERTSPHWFVPQIALCMGITCSIPMLGARHVDEFSKRNILAIIPGL